MNGTHRSYSRRALFAWFVLSLIAGSCGFSLAAYQIWSTASEVVPWEVENTPVALHASSPNERAAVRSVVHILPTTHLSLQRSSSQLESGPSSTLSFSQSSEDSTTSDNSTEKSCPSIQPRLESELWQLDALLDSSWPCSVDLDEYRFVQLKTLGRMQDMAQIGALCLGLITGFFLTSQTLRR